MRIRGRRVILLIAGALPLLANDDHHHVSAAEVLGQPEEPQSHERQLLHGEEDEDAARAAEALHDDSPSLLPLNLLQVQAEFSGEPTDLKTFTQGKGKVEFSAFAAAQHQQQAEDEEASDNAVEKEPPDHLNDSEATQGEDTNDGDATDDKHQDASREKQQTNDDKSRDEAHTEEREELLNTNSDDVKDDESVKEGETTNDERHSENESAEAKETLEGSDQLNDNNATGTTSDDAHNITDTTNTTEQQHDSYEGGGGTMLQVDYASKSAGALVLEKSPNFKGTSNLLNGDRDRYAISPCSENPKFVVLSLSEDILVKQVKLTNYELYSSRVKDFEIQISQTMGNWADLGSFTASAVSGVQTFDLEEPAWGRYLKFKFTSHYGDEFYCTLSQIMVHGSTMVQGFHEHLQEEETNDDDEYDYNMEDEEEDNNNNVEEAVAASEEEHSADDNNNHDSDSSSNSDNEKEDSDAHNNNDKVSEGTEESSASAGNEEDENDEHENANEESSGVSGGSSEGGDDRGPEEQEKETAESNENTEADSSITSEPSTDTELTRQDQENAASAGEGSASKDTEQSDERGHGDSKTKEDNDNSSKDDTGTLNSQKDRNSSTVLPLASIGLSSNNVFTTMVSRLEPLHLKGMDRLSNFGASGFPDSEKLHNILAKATDSTNAIKNALTDRAILESLQVWTAGGGEGSNYLSGYESVPPEAFGTTEVGPREQTLTEKLTEYIQHDRHDTQMRPTSEKQDLNNDVASSDVPVSAQKDAIEIEDSSHESEDDDEVAKETEDQHANVGEQQLVDTKITNHGSVANPYEALRDTDVALATLLEKLPSIECLKKLDFAAFKEKKEKALASRKGGHGGHGHAAAGHAMEPIFKMLTGQIKSLQSNLSVHDQFTKEAVQCYQRVLLDVVVEMQTVKMDHEARLAKLEQDLHETKTVRWVFVIYQLIMGLPNWASLFLATFFTSFVSPSAISRPIEIADAVLRKHLPGEVHFVLSWTLTACLMILSVVSTVAMCQRIWEGVRKYKVKFSSSNDPSEEVSCRLAVEKDATGAIVSIATVPSDAARDSAEQRPEEFSPKEANRSGAAYHDSTTKTPLSPSSVAILSEYADDKEVESPHKPELDTNEREPSQTFWVRPERFSEDEKGMELELPDPQQVVPDGTSSTPSKPEQQENVASEGADDVAQEAGAWESIAPGVDRGNGGGDACEGAESEEKPNLPQPINTAPSNSEEKQGDENTNSDLEDAACVTPDSKQELNAKESLALAYSAVEAN